MIQFELVTPERILFSEKVLAISLPTLEGEITILPGHAPLVARLVAGVARVKKQSGEEDIALSSGFIEIQSGNIVRVLADTAERASELDLNTIELAKKRAEQIMQETLRSNDVQYAQAAAGMQRELARYRVAKKHATHKSPINERATISDQENAL